MSTATIRATARVREFLTARRQNNIATDFVATEHYHDGAGHAVAVLLTSDLTALVMELDGRRSP